MLVPIKCFGCGLVLGNKYYTYQRMVRERKYDGVVDLEDRDEEFLDLTQDEVKKTIEGHVLDELGLISQCCRMNMLTVVNLLAEIAY